MALPSPPVQSRMRGVEVRRPQLLQITATTTIATADAARRRLVGRPCRSLWGRGSVGFNDAVLFHKHGAHFDIGGKIYQAVILHCRGWRQRLAVATQAVVQAIGVAVVSMDG